MKGRSAGTARQGAACGQPAIVSRPFPMLWRPKPVSGVGCGYGRDVTMARPREFDEAAVLDAAIEKFWLCGYEATSVRDLAEEMDIAGASLYNAFGDKR